MNNCDVAIIGAGPYGLSIAAHLKARGVSFRIFGKPMHTWLTQMPKGMRLKSEGFASSLFDPGSTFTLQHYCQERGLPYSDTALPVPLETFAAYGLEFQKRLVPELEDVLVSSVKKTSEGFRLTLADGQVVAARRVVVAVGIAHYGYVPPILADLPDELMSHSSKYGALDHFKGREVVVVGAGASALDVAALLSQAGASVQLVVRESVIRFHDPPQKRARTFWENLRRPMTGIGSGWYIFFCTQAPFAFRLLPESTRFKAVRKILGPAPGWFIKQEVVGRVPFNLGMNITRAVAQSGKVSLELVDKNGVKKTLSADHVIAATGYKVDLRRLDFLGADLQGEIKAVEHTPVLSAHFESSVPGLYFVGTSSANTFGPLMRFAFGAGFTAGNIAKHLGESAVRQLPAQDAARALQTADRG